MNYHFQVLYSLRLKTGHTLMHLEKVLPKATQCGQRESAGRHGEAVPGAGAAAAIGPPLPRKGHGDGDHGRQDRLQRKDAAMKEKAEGRRGEKLPKKPPKCISTEVTRKLPMLSLFLHVREFLSNLFFFFLKTLKLEENRALYMCFHIHFLIRRTCTFALIYMSRSSADTLERH